MFYHSLSIPFLHCRPLTSVDFATIILLNEPWGFSKPFSELQYFTMWRCSAQEYLPEHRAKCLLVSVAFVHATGRLCPTGSGLRLALTNDDASPEVQFPPSCSPSGQHGCWGFFCPLAARLPRASVGGRRSTANLAFCCGKRESNSDGRLRLRAQGRLSAVMTHTFLKTLLNYSAF